MKLAAITLNYLGNGRIGFGQLHYPAGVVQVTCVQSRGPQGVPVLRASGFVPAIGQWLQDTLTQGNQAMASEVILEARRRGRLQEF